MDENRTILDTAISVWAPMKDGMPYLAMIEGLSYTVVFKAETAISAKRNADDFRLIEFHNIVGDNSFPDAHRPRLIKAQERAAAKRLEREAKD